MADNDAASKNEKPTPQKRTKAREQGQFARARDAGGVAASIAVVLALATIGPSIVRQVRLLTRACLSEPFDLVHGDAGTLARRALPVLVLSIVPLGLAAAIASTAVGFAEAGFQPKLDLVLPKWSRIDPLGKLKHMLSPTTAALEITMSVARIGAVGVVAYKTLEAELPTMVRLSRSSLEAGVGELFAAAARLTVRAALALAVLAALDWAQSKWRLERQLMMSKQEVKEEFKQAEGDPHVKQRLRARARERLKRGLAKQVRLADVVLANPTHVSVALRYRPAEGAPVVLAKGYDEVALYMRKVAAEADVPILESPPLARALASRVRPGRVIPVDLYAAVAQVLAVVYRLKKKRGWLG